jgi:hypothetical protein
MGSDKSFFHDRWCTSSTFLSQRNYDVVGIRAHRMKTASCIAHMRIALIFNSLAMDHRCVPQRLHVNQIES